LGKTGKIVRKWFLLPPPQKLIEFLILENISTVKKHISLKKNILLKINQPTIHPPPKVN
jgi:hypothetical protein